MKLAISNLTAPNAVIIKILYSGASYFVLQCRLLGLNPNRLRIYETKYSDFYWSLKKLRISTCLLVNNIKKSLTEFLVTISLNYISNLCSIIRSNYAFLLSSWDLVIFPRKIIIVKLTSRMKNENFHTSNPTAISLLVSCQITTYQNIPFFTPHNHKKIILKNE